jgi:hypothetical protein
MVFMALLNIFLFLRGVTPKKQLQLFRIFGTTCNICIPPKSPNIVSPVGDSELLGHPTAAASAGIT